METLTNSDQSDTPRQTKPRDLKYRCLLEGLTDDPEIIAGARFIDEICLREQGVSESEAKCIVKNPCMSRSEDSTTAPT